MNTNRALFGIFFVLALAGLGFFIYRDYLAPAPQAEPTATSQPGGSSSSSTSTSETISAEAKVVPNSYADLAFTQPGRVVQVLVKEGDSVKASDPLVRLDQASIEAKLSQAQSALQTAQAGLDAARTRVEQVTAAAQAQDQAARIEAWKADQPSDLKQPNWYFDKTEQITSTLKEVDTAQKDLATEQANLDAVLKNASSADLLAAEKRLSDAQTSFLVANDVLTRAKAARDNQDLQDQAQNTYDSAKSELDAAQANYDQILTTKGASDVMEARARLAVAQEVYNTALDRLRSLQTGSQSLDVRSAQEAEKQAEAAVNEAQAAVDAAQVALKDSTLTAPMDGVVTQLSLNPGEMASPGITVITVADLSSWKVDTTDLAEGDVASLSPGMKAKITLDAFPNRTFEGEVTRVAYQSENTRGSVTYQVTLNFNPNGAAVRWGMTAYVDLLRPQ